MGAWEDGQKLVAVLRSQPSILKVRWRMGQTWAIAPSLRQAPENGQKRERDGDSL